MKERPILFSAPMVRALLDRTKTQTRRAFSEKNLKLFSAAVAFGEISDFLNESQLGKNDLGYVLDFCPYGKIGGELWVREEHYRFGHWEPVPGVRTKTGRMKWRFVADSEEVLFDAPAEFRKGRHHKDSATPAWHKRLARFMPRKYSRITLEITGVKVERLQDVSEEDAKAEGLLWNALYREWGGVEKHPCSRPECPQWRWYEKPETAFRYLWESINGPDSWTENPWVWAISFKRVAS